MPLDPRTLAAARKYRAAATIELLEAYFPRVQRLALGLCGQIKTADRAMRAVLARAMIALPKWRDEADAERWFYHHSILTIRQILPPSSQGGVGDDDPLLAPDLRTDGAYRAFLRVLRAMPQQPREAFLLHHGEHLNDRYIGVAMDCSADASAVHRRVATEALAAMAGGEMQRLTDALARAYAALAPPPPLVRPVVRSLAGRMIRAHQLRKWLRRGLVLTAAALVACAAWRVWR